MTRGQDRVSDDEELYRSVRETVAGQLCYRIQGGQVVFSQAAFNDRSMRPSIDRAKLRDFDPHRSRLSREDGIVALRADAIRRLGPITQFDNRQRPLTQHAVDVIPDWIIGNCAHALVTTHPPVTGPSAFRRLKEGLAWLANEAGWRVEPGTTLPQRKLLAIVHDIFRCALGRLPRAK